MYSVKISPPSSHAVDGSAQRGTETCAITKHSISSLHLKEDIALSVLLRLHKNVITSTLFTWEPKKMNTDAAALGEESYRMVEILFPWIQILSGFISYLELGSIGEGCTRFALL